MNAKSRILFALMAVVMMFGLFYFEQPASAQSPNSNCKQARGNWLDVYPGTGNATFGTIANAGRLNGTTETIFNSPAFATPDPTTVSYTAETTITTEHGQLKTSNVYLFDFVTGLGTILMRINSDTSTGIFAGATGGLFAGGKSPDGGITFPLKITGEICFANE